MPDLVLRAATLIDGTGAEPIRPGEVTIRDGNHRRRRGARPKRPG